MFRTRMVLCIAAALVLVGGGLLGQDDKTDPTKARGQLPPNWKQLGLSKEQIQKVYQTQQQYRDKMYTLQQQIDKLKGQEKAELEKVLTPAQKERLREILASKAPGGDAPKDKDKKPEKK